MRALVTGLLAFLATLIAATALLHALLLAAPGDAIDLLPNGEELRPALEREWRLDRPAPERVAGAVLDVLRGDLGTSLIVRPGAPVAELVLESGAASLSRLLPALGLSLGLGVALAARGPGRRSSWITAALSALPVFLLAWLAVTGLNALAWALLERGLIDRPSWFALPDQPSALRSAIAASALAIGSGALAEVRAAAADELGRAREAPFIDATRALGLPVARHLLLNLAPPLATVLASRAAFFVGGLVVVEKVLLTGGAGALLWDAALGRDAPLALGLGLLAASAVAGARLLADLLRLALDPRLREATG